MAAAAAMARRVSASLVRMLPTSASRLTSPAYAFRQIRPLYNKAIPKEQDKLDSVIQALARMEKKMKPTDQTNKDYEKRLARAEAIIYLLGTVVGTMFAYTMSQPGMINKIQYGQNSHDKRIELLENEVLMFISR